MKATLFRVSRESLAHAYGDPVMTEKLLEGDGYTETLGVYHELHCIVSPTVPSLVASHSSFHIDYRYSCHVRNRPCFKRVH